MLRYLLDTDVFSELARGRNEKLLTRVGALGTAALAVSVVSEAEVRYGLACRPMPAHVTARIDALLGQIQRLPMGVAVAGPYAALRAELRRAGTPIGPNDIWIAAHALSENLTLVTGNVREFARVPGLRVENWLR